MPCQTNICIDRENESKQNLLSLGSAILWWPLYIPRSSASTQCFCPSVHILHFYWYGHTPTPTWNFFRWFKFVEMQSHIEIYVYSSFCWWHVLWILHFISISAPPPPPPPVPPLAPEMPAVTPSKMNVKRINWEKLDQQRVGNTIWEQVGSYVMNFQKGLKKLISVCMFCLKWMIYLESTIYGKISFIKL